MNSQLIPTKEQLKIISAFSDLKGIMKINSFAGTGKTKTLEMLAKTESNTKILYLVYNKSMQVDAKKVFPKNVEVLTVHALAYQELTKTKPLGKISPLTLSEVIGITGITKNDAHHTLTELTEYCNSDNLHPEGKYKAHINNLIDKMENGNRSFTFDYLLKKLQISLFKKIILINYDCIFLDEAQDSNQVTISIFKLINAQKKVVVGDKHQQIYSFRGSANAFKSLKGKKLNLTESFRLPKEIAKCASTLLHNMKLETYQIKSQINGCDFDFTFNDPKMSVGHIFRGNKLLIQTMLEMIEEGTKFVTIRNPDEIFRLLVDIGYFYQKIFIKISSQNSYLKQFESLDALILFAERTNNHQLKSNLEIFQQKFYCDLDWILRIKKIANTNFNESTRDKRHFLTTAHSSKGLEFDCTIIYDDFIPFPKIINLLGFDNYKKFKQQFKTIDSKFIDEINLFYVAITRCKLAMHIKDCNYYYVVDNGLGFLVHDLQQ